MHPLLPAVEMVLGNRIFSLFIHVGEKQPSCVFYVPVCGAEGTDGILSREAKVFKLLD
jgi:hypothetical protein